MAVRTANQSEFAAEIGVDRSRITVLKKQGRLVFVGSLIDVEASKKKLKESSDPRYATSRRWKDTPGDGEEESTSAADSSPGTVPTTVSEETAKKLNLQSQEIELRLRKEIGELVESEDASRIAFESARSFRDELVRETDSLASEMKSVAVKYGADETKSADIEDEMRTEIENRFRALLTRVTDYIGSLGLE